MTEIVDVADLDCIFLTYDEPNKEENWIKVSNMVPWAKRVDGVVGSDAAHKAAADASETERFILIDGDNVPDPTFFNLQLTLNDITKDVVFRWRARNEINGLCYGNGGISCWTREFAYSMQTHEASDGKDENNVEFCYYPNYWAMHDCYSSTSPNVTSYQAWRAGFREGVKLALDRGRLIARQDFTKLVNVHNLSNLLIWQSVGQDVEHGWWAMFGARMGTHMVMFQPEWDYTMVHDFAALTDLFNDVVPSRGADLELVWSQMTTDLKCNLGLRLVEFDADQSRFFKEHYVRQFQNKGIMAREK